MSSKRDDAFAVEGQPPRTGGYNSTLTVSLAYETSLHLATMFKNSRQISFIYPHLFSMLYPSVPSTTITRDVTVTIALLHELSSGFPSQTQFLGPYMTHVRNASPLAKPLYLWLKEVAASLRCSNYFIFEAKTCRGQLFRLLRSIDPSFENHWVTGSSESGQHLQYKAFMSAVHVLQEQAQKHFWSIIRTAYRELGLHPESVDNRKWLARSLALLHSDWQGDEFSAELDRWIEDEGTKGTIARKEGAVGRWTLVRPR